MNKYVLIYILFAVWSIPTIGQDNGQWTPEEKNKSGKGFDWSKVYVGGGLALQFGNYTFIDVSPTLSYRLTDNFSTGFGISYKYLSYKSIA